MIRTVEAPHAARKRSERTDPALHQGTISRRVVTATERRMLVARTRRSRDVAARGPVRRPATPARRHRASGVPAPPPATGDRAHALLVPGDALDPGLPSTVQADPEADPVLEGIPARPAILLGGLAGDLAHPPQGEQGGTALA